jgi:hypothetical protein
MRGDDPTWMRGGPIVGLPSAPGDDLGPAFGWISLPSIFGWFFGRSVPGCHLR